MPRQSVSAFLSLEADVDNDSNESSELGEDFGEGSLTSTAEASTHEVA
jgi:hypothetical protein